MAQYSEIFSGGGRLGGCGKNLHELSVPSFFTVGDFAYSAWAADRGRLERICIKKIHIVKDSVSERSFNYQDTLNTIYMEEDLYEYQEAAAAIASWKVRHPDPIVCH